MKMKFKIQTLITCYLLLTTISANAQKLDTTNIVAYIKQYKNIAIAEMKRSGIPASITLAQGIHESSFGTSYLAKNTNNHFGIKCKDTWTGKTFKYTDDAPNECFRVYDNVEESYKDHTEFLKRPRYADLFLLDKYDYKGWAAGLKKAGYATNPKYAPILIKTIEDFQLYAFDKGVNPSYLNTEMPVIIEQDEESIYKVTDSIEIDNQYQPTNNKNIDVVKTSVETAQQKPNFNKPVNKTITKINNVKSVKFYNGETLDLIANALKIEKDDLLKYNDITDESQIKVGQSIFIQQKKKSNSEATYKIKQEDNIWSISQKKGIRLSSLLKMNKLEPGEEPAVKETITLKGKIKDKPKLRTAKEIKAVPQPIITAKPTNTVKPSNSIKAEQKSEKSALENLGVEIVRARDTIYPAITEPIQNASAVDSARLLGWEKSTKLLEKPAIIAPTKENITQNIPKKEVEIQTIVKKEENITDKLTPTVYPISIDYNKLPKSTSDTHIIVKGDTMYNISKRYNISIAQIMEWNNLSEQVVKLGQELKIQQ